jgi:hypothetical protein
VIDGTRDHLGNARTITVPRGAYVVFDEIYEANVGAYKLADMVVAKEVAWRRQYPGFRVSLRVADPAGKQQRDDWREHNPPLRTSWFLPNRDKEPTITTMQDLVGDKRYFVDSRASRHADDLQAWRQKDGKEVHDDASHSAAAARYVLSNLEVLEKRKAGRDSRAELEPVVVQRSSSHTSKLGSVPVNSMRHEERWRSQLGGITPRGR